MDGSADYVWRTQAIVADYERRAQEEQARLARAARRTLVTTAIAVILAKASRRRQWPA